MIKDTITVVKKAENEAASIAKLTEEKQQTMLNQARHEANSFEQQLRQQILENRTKAEKKANRTNQEVMQRAEEGAKQKIALLKKQVEEKRMEAIQLIFDTIG